MSKERNKDSINNLSFVKTILMILVVLDHSMSFWTGEWFTKNPVFLAEPLKLFSSFLGSFHTYSFTLVSGYLFYHLRCEKEKYAHYLLFIKQKAVRLLVPYAFIAAVWVIPWSCLFLSSPQGTTLVSKYILGTSPSQLWFLLMLFGVFAIFHPLTGFFQEKHIFGAITVIGFYGIGIVGQTAMPNYFQIFRTCMYFPLFWLGFKLRQFERQGVQRIPVWVWALVYVLVLFLFQYTSRFDSVIFKLLHIGFEFVLHIVGALTAFAVLQKIADKTHWRDSNIFGLISKLSFPVYLFHQQVLYIFIYLLNGLLNPYVHVIVNFVGALGISLGLSAVLRRFRITRFLLGEK